MKLKKILVYFLLFIIRKSTSDDWKFPSDFKFGAATSAYQIEGGWDADGKGVSIWDTLTNRNPSIALDGSTGNVACDSYHKWATDVEMLKNLSADFYRFSLSWTRILPGGFANDVNQKGVDYYNNLIDALLDNGIEPVVTLFHWDSPQIFSHFASLNNPAFVDLFAHFAELSFELFGDRVKTWITFNEPKVVCQDYSELMGQLNEVYPNGVVEYMCTHNVVKAHAKAYHIYDSQFRNKFEGKVGITLNFEWSEEASPASQDVAAAEQRRQFEFGLFANPVVFGDYPQIVKDRVATRSKAEGFPESRLPKFTVSESNFIRGSYDFLGLNHYNSWLVQPTVEDVISVQKPSYEADMGTQKHADPSWESNEWNGQVVPWGMRKTLNWIKNTYNNPIVIITECGYPDKTGTLDDDARINYLQGYLNATLQAIIEDKVRVQGFAVWSLMDNFEWGQGYTVKFGLYHVNFTDPERTRTPKKSAHYFRDVIQFRTV